MKVYTKTGDKGKTSLFGGARVPKSHDQIAAYGTLDELNSWMGMLRDHAISESEKAILVHIQETLFTVGSYLATDPNKADKMKLPALSEDLIEGLERQMDEMDAHLPELRVFVLPGGHKNVSYCHIARTVCRRAERCIVSLDETQIGVSFAARYINRLSDYLFVLSRFWAHHLGAEEIPWNPKY